MKKIEAMMVTAREVPGTEFHEIVLVIGDWDNDFYTVSGFDSVREANEFAEMVAKACSISTDNIFGDVNDGPTLIRIK